jgi:cytosine/adenosine deaminase-related metal-dependent hydrolase
MSIYIRDATFIDWQTHEFTTGNLCISEGDKGNVEFVDTCPADAYEGKDKIVTKSFACGHHHAYSALARGMPPTKKQPKNFKQILEYIWWNLDKKLDREMIRASALVTAMACAKNGVTFIIDHHASPFAVEDSLEIIAEAFVEIGVGHLLCYELSDRDGEESREQGLKETERFLQKHQGLVGLHASFTVGDNLLKSAIVLAQAYDSGIHIHVAEDKADQEECLKSYQCRVIERLDRFGALNYPKTILAHCIHLNKNERDILANSKAWIAVNTESNLNNEVGLFSNEENLEHKVFLGTDGMHSDMIRSAQINYFTHKEKDKISIGDSYSRLRRVHHYLRSNNFSGDADNSLVILDYKSPTPVNEENWLGHFFYGLDSSYVTGAIANGQWILKDRELIRVDESENLQFAREQAERLWEKLRK